MLLLSTTHPPPEKGVMPQKEIHGNAWSITSPAAKVGWETMYLLSVSSHKVQTNPRPGLCLPHHPQHLALNRKYKDYESPFYGLNDEIPILLTLLLGLQHALTMVGSIASQPLAIAGGAFNFDATITQYLVSAAFITTGIATAL
jgi:hypothetical protein